METARPLWHLPLQFGGTPARGGQFRAAATLRRLHSTFSVCRNLYLSILWLLGRRSRQKGIKERRKSRRAFEVGCRRIPEEGRNLKR